jgi:pimeloyl-ACP methyl ester carboxylesterase
MSWLWRYELEDFMLSKKRYTPMGMTKLALFTLVLVYLALSPVLLFLKFEFFPLKTQHYQMPEVIEKLNPETVSFKASNGCNLYGFYITVPKARYTVIVHHGQGANISYDGYAQTAEVFARAGANVLLYDYEGFGRSEGQPSSAALRRDALAAYEFAIARGATAGSIVQCGISLGTGAAADIATRQPCKAVVLISPYLALSQVAQEHLPYLCLYPALFYPQPDLGSRCLLGKHMPLLMVHSISDPVLPISQADKLAKSYESTPQLLTYYRVPDGGHIGALSDDGHSANGTVQICKSFFDRLDKLAIK